jgi:hypothetical protein
MCYAVYVGTSNNLELGEFIPNQTDIYLQKLSEEEELSLRPKFSKPNIYYVGADTGCSCGLVFDSDDFDDPEEQVNKKSPMKFLEFLNELTLHDDIECYCCWEGDWDLPIEYFQEIDIKTISLDKNYFGFTEREFLRFRKQD